MKNTPRIRHENGSKKPVSQGKTSTITGQKPAINGLFGSDNAAVRVLAEWENVTPEEYINKAVCGVIQASIEDAKITMRDGSLQQKQAARKVLLSLPIEYKQPVPRSNNGKMMPGTIPKALADQAKAALDELSNASRPAITLLMMAATTLSEEVNCHEPEHDDLCEWRKLVDLNFQGGLFDLVIDQVSRFHDALREWQIIQLSIITGQPKCESKTHLEHEVYGLNTLNRYLSDVMTKHYSSGHRGVGASLLCGRVCQNLHGALLKSLTNFNQLHDAVEGLVNGQSLREAA